MQHYYPPPQINQEVCKALISEESFQICLKVVLASKLPGQEEQGKTKTADGLCVKSAAAGRSPEL